MEKVVITQFNTNRWVYAPVYAKWLALIFLMQWNLKHLCAAERCLLFEHVC